MTSDIRKVLPELRRGVAANRGLGNSTVIGRVVSVRAESETETGTVFYLADVEMTGSSGRTATIRDCLATVPVRAGIPVVLQLTAGDIARPGIITGHAVPPRPQEVLLQNTLDNAPMGVRYFRGRDIRTGVIRSIDPVSLGSGVNPARATVIIEDDPASGGSGAIARVEAVSQGGILSAEVLFGGVGFTETPTLTVESTNGSGARLTAILSNNRIIDVVVDSPGQGYTDDDISVVVSGGGPAANTDGIDFEFDINRGTVPAYRIVVDEGGAGYTERVTARLGGAGRGTGSQLSVNLVDLLDDPGQLTVNDNPWCVNLTSGDNPFTFDLAPPSNGFEVSTLVGDIIYSLFETVYDTIISEITDRFIYGVNNNPYDNTRFFTGGAERLTPIDTIPRPPEPGELISPTEGIWPKLEVAAGEEQYIHVTNDVMQFEVEQIFDRIGLFRNSVSYGGVKRYERGGSVPFLGRVGSYLNVVGFAALPVGMVQLETRTWIVLVDEETGRRYSAGGIRGDILLGINDTTLWRLNLELGGYKTSILGGGRYAAAQDIQITEMVAFSDGHTWNVLFDGLAESMGKDLRVDYYYQVAVKLPDHAKFIPSDSMRFDGTWRLQLRELGYGSGLPTRTAQG